MQSAGWKKTIKNDERTFSQYKKGRKVVAKEGARLAGGCKIRWGPRCLQFVSFPSLLQAEAGEFIRSVAAWFIAVLAQRSHKTTGEIFPGVVTVPGLRRCPKALGSELVWEGRLQPWRSSHLEEHPLATWVLCWKHIEPLGYKFPTSTSHPCLLLDFQCPCMCCQPSEAPWALVGCSRCQAAASRERTCQLAPGRDLDCFLLTSRALHVQISLLPHWQVAGRAGGDGSADFSSLPGRCGGGECFVGLVEGRDGGWREERTHCEEHRLPPLWLCSSNNFTNTTLSAISTI